MTDEMETLGPWHQRIELPNGSATPGKWDVQKQAEFIRKNSPWPLGGRALDAGGNAGGISISLRDTFHELIVLETSATNHRQFDFVSSHLDTSKIRFDRNSLFTAHHLGAFDVTFMLGLVYHFRHPQLFLDYCSQLECERFVFSTPVRQGSDKTLWNRSQIPAYTNRGMLGWHPTPAAFAEMLNSSGFELDSAHSIADPDFTNNYYVFATRRRSIAVDMEAVLKIANSEAFWT